MKASVRLKTASPGALVLSLLLTLLILSFWVQGAEAACPYSYTMYVDWRNTGYPDGSMAHPYRTIGDALFFAPPNSCIYVLEGTYSENIVIAKEGIYLYSLDMYQTIIEGSFLGPVITVGNVNNVTIAGFTIRYGLSDPANSGGGNGGGIQLNHTTGTVIEDCWITQNEATSDGGGIYCNYSAPEIRSCIISDNKAQRGGGIYAYYQQPRITGGTQITDNQALVAGGGIYCGSSAPIIEGNTVISNNEARSGTAYRTGGGIYCNNANPLIQGNTVISYNRAAYGGGIVFNDSSGTIQGGAVISHNQADQGGGIYLVDAKPVISTCTIENNVATLEGGGIYATGDSDEPATIGSAAVIENNQANQGGGIYLNDSSPNMMNAYIDNNLASLQGGGIALVSGASPTINHCWIRYNETVPGPGVLKFGGGIYSDASAPVITDSTIQENTSTFGGGLYIYYDQGMSPSITHNIISDNQCLPYGSTNAKGGGLFLTAHYEAENFTINHNDFIGNTASRGGGIYNDETPDLVISNCLFESNEVSTSGAGIYNHELDSITIDSCEFIENVSQGTGGGVYNHDTDMTVTNCTFVFNHSLEGGGINTNLSSNDIANCTFYNNTDDWIFIDGGDFNIVNTIFRGAGVLPAGEGFRIVNACSGNQCVISHSDIDGDWTGIGTGNIDADPHFVNPGFPGGNYHLLPSSPCRDTGTDDTVTHPYLPPNDIDGDARPQFSTYDIGADEFSPIFVPGDYGTTIQAAINAAMNGDTILVAPGDYPERINFLGKAITVRSETGADTTTIDAEDGGSVVTFENGEGADSVLEGFTIINGRGTGSDGGGITLNGASPTISKCLITGNTAGYGAGIRITGGSPTFINCIVSDNQIAGTFGTGGGAYMNGASPRFLHCTFYGNYAYNTGGGMQCHDATPIVTNSILWGDTNSGGVNEINLTGTSTIDIAHSTIQDNDPDDAVIYSGSGNLDDDPLLMDPAGNDFRPSSLSACVDRGTSLSPIFGVSLPDDDLESIARPQGQGFDMGAHEHPAAVVEPGGTIQAAIDAAVPYSTVLVQNGTYFENINFNGKPITVKSENGPEFTIINGSGSGSVVSFNTGEGADSVIEGFAITNGAGTEVGDLRNGGGIYCISASPVIRNCIIKDNTLTTVSGHSSAGGGIYLNNASPALYNCTIADNTGIGFAYGGGIYLDASSPSIVHCTLSGNWTGVYGGGIYCINNSSPTVLNSILWGNEGVGSSDEVYLANAASTITITFSDINPALITGPGTPTLSDTINDDPDFENPVGGNYHLTPSSPCIEAGTDIALNLPADDIDGDHRPAGDHFDIGSDEYVCLDLDGDTFLSQAGCGTLVDCNDRDNTVYPGAPEICDTQDNDCDGLTDDADPGFTGFSTFYRDQDGDGQGDLLQMTQACTPPTGYVTNTDDCDDSDNTKYLGAPELCDGKDNDCDTLIDNADPDFVGFETFYRDADEDGYGEAGSIFEACTAPSGYVENDDDCDDTDPDVNPGEAEVPYNGKNDDCNPGTPDDDLDGDGFLNASDCNDNDENFNPDAPELCDGLDNNCDTMVPANEADGDGDGFRICEGDCDDSNNAIYPGVPEFVDGIDNDCDGYTDEINVGSDPQDDYFTIQAAINAAATGRTIVVRAGTYPENIDFLGKQITVTSMDGPEVTIIDGTQNGSVVTFQSGETQSTVLDGFTVTNGIGTGYHTNGGGIYCINTSAATVMNCIIENNHAENHGGGIYLLNAPDFSIEGCRLSGNTAVHRGGGLYAESSTVTLSNCTVEENTGDMSFLRGGGIFTISTGLTLSGCTVDNNTAPNGGGIYISNTSTLSMTGCRVRGNTATSQGGGLFDSAITSTIQNCLFTGNAAHQGGGIFDSATAATYYHATISGNTAYYRGGGIYTTRTTTLIVNSIVWGNLAGNRGDELQGAYTVAFSDIGMDDLTAAPYAGPGNINLPPLFANSHLATDAPTTRGAYHLLETSGCIDAGTDDGVTYPGLPLSTDIHGDSRFQELGYDMGADEYVVYGAAPAAPDTPTATAASAVAIDLSFTDNAANEQGFVVERKKTTGGMFQQVAVLGPDETTCQDGGLSPGTDYTYRVKAYNNMGNSAWSDEAATQTTSAATILACAAGGDYATIQEAIDAAVDGDTVAVCDGTYLENINYRGKAITVASQNGPLSTTIEGNSSGTVVTFNTGEKYTSKLEGFTVTGGSASNGGGIAIDSYIYTSPMISQCIISQNTVSTGGRGGGIFCQFGAPEITLCTVSANSGWGGGIFGQDADIALNSCTISNNTSANYNGGGLSFYASTLSTNDSTLEGNSAYQGAGAYFSDSSVTFIECHIINNIASYGGGIYSNAASIDMENCTVSGNTAVETNGQGGGMYLTNTTSSIVGCVISGNIAARGAGGILENGGTILSNCFVTGNSAYQGAGWFGSGTTSVIQNSTISGNHALYRGGGINEQNNILVINSIVYGNTAVNVGQNIMGTADVTWSDIGMDNPLDPHYPGVGNIHADPYFVNGRPASEAPTTAGDYHLQDISPCIDGGDNSSVPGWLVEDIDEEDRIIDGDANSSLIVDMGADEYNPGEIPCQGDFNGDGDVDSGDLADLVDAFGATTFSPNFNPMADMNGDGIINNGDLILFAPHLGRTRCF